MKLTSEHIAFIHQDLRRQGVTMNSLLDSLVDHICCLIEKDKYNVFNEAYNNALKSFGEVGLAGVQLNTITILNTNPNNTMKKTTYLLSYVVALLASFGLLFVQLHWKGGAVLLITAFVVFNFGWLPLYLIGKYKRSLT